MNEWMDYLRGPHVIAQLLYKNNICINYWQTQRAHAFRVKKMHISLQMFLFKIFQLSYFFLDFFSCFKHFIRFDCQSIYFFLIATKNWVKVMLFFVEIFLLIHEWKSQIKKWIWAEKRYKESLNDHELNMLIAEWQVFKFKW